MQINFQFISRSHHIRNFYDFSALYECLSSRGRKKIYASLSMSVSPSRFLSNINCFCMQMLTSKNILRINDDLTSWANKRQQQQRTEIYVYMCCWFNAILNFFLCTHTHTHIEKNAVFSTNERHFFLLATIIKPHFLFCHLNCNRWFEDDNFDASKPRSDFSMDFFMHFCYHENQKWEFNLEVPNWNVFINDERKKI